MKSILKAEFRKLLTVRSTYIFTLLSILIVIFFAFYVEGYRAQEYVADPGKLANSVIQAISFVTVFAAIAGLLLMSNEYRHNTIAYTFTAARSRSQVLLAKIIVVSVYVAGFALFIGTLSPVMTYLGLQLKGVGIGPQVIPVWDLVWRSVFFAWGYAMVALLVATLIRNLVFAIIFLFVVPNTIEGLLGILLKENTAYLPFSALGNVILGGAFSHVKAAVVFVAYLIAGWLVAWYLFRRRDAN